VVKNCEFRQSKIISHSLLYLTRPIRCFQKKKKKKKSQTKKWRMLGSSHATRISQSRSRSGDACGIQGARHNPFHLFFFLKRRQSAFRSSNLEHIVITRAMRVEKETHNKRLIYIELIKEEYPLE
jgi:hypothetical protein